MVDIDRYLSRYNLLHDPRYVRLRYVYEGFPREIKNKYKSSFIEIYSTNIFPRRIKANGEQYIVIDHHFGNLYAHYSSAYLCAVNRLAVDIDRDFLKYIMESLIVLSQASLQENIPSLALSFAQEYAEMGCALGKYDSLLNLLGKDQLLNQTEIFANMFTISHEIGHIRYNDYQKEDNGYLEFLGMLEGVSAIDDSEYGAAIVEMSNILKSGDKTILEELYCDYLAVLETIDVVKKVIGSGTSTLELAKVTIESIMLSIGFQALLIQNKLYWQMMYYQSQNENEKVDIVQKTIKREFSQLQVRGSFLYLLAHLNICKTFYVDFKADYFIKSSAFDDASFELFRLSSTRILERAKWNEKKYSDQELKSMRNRLLEWR